MGLFGYRLLLKIENLLLKILSKIIFKCVNSAIEPSFKAKFAEFRTCGSRVLFTGPSQKNANAQNTTTTVIQTHTI